MALIEYWIQIENRPWDMSPHNIDRMTGQDMATITGKAPVMATLNSVVPGTPPRMVKMYHPLRDGAGAVTDALIFRRYKAPTKPDKSDAWTVPDDRKVNPWDLNEHNPGEKGTMGTIPGPVLELNVGDSIIVHFKNADSRVGVDAKTRTHSLHPHGVGFKRHADGAYPLSPPDPSQSVGAEAPLWVGIGVTGSLKQGDRVPPGATFDYLWETFGWPTTAGVWLYHDHSICDMDSVELGAIGIIVVHNPADTGNEVDIRTGPDTLDPTLLPNSSPVGNPTFLDCLPIKTGIPILPHQLAGLGDVGGGLHSHDPGISDLHDVADHENDKTSIKINGQMFGLNLDLNKIIRFCNSRYLTPPPKMLILQLYHTLQDGFLCINGRQYLGNTPTIISGTATKMKFGVVGMGSMFHTFHLHGHRWVLNGPDGITPGAIQSSAQVSSTSQFEDTRTFGPANSFGFTINGASGSFMRAGGPGSDDSLGEWHMHCHVLNHMMTGMMGSLLIVKGGELAGGLPVGVPCPPTGSGGGVSTHEVHLTIAATFSPSSVMINAGDTVTWKWDDGTPHSVTSDTALFDSTVLSGSPPLKSFSHTFAVAGTYPYHCVVHGGSGGIGMSGTVTVM